MSELRFKVTGVGKSAPARVVPSEEIDSKLGLPSGWIEKRTGIAERRYAADSDTASSLGTEAGRQALERAGLEASDLDLIVVATGTPDYLFPPTAALVQQQLGAGEVGAFDLEAACAGFVYGLLSAGSLISTGTARSALVIGVDLPTKLLNPDDAATVAVFGDGCGAAVLQSHPEGDLVGARFGSDGSRPEDIYVHGGGSKTPRALDDEVFPHIRMKGREVYRYAVRAMTRIGEEAGASEHDLVIMHQANRRIVDECASVLGLRDDQIFTNVDRYGNTSAASVAIALCEAWEQGRLQEGTRLLLIGFGAGYTWSTLSLVWSAPGLDEQPSRQAVSVEVG